jgi:hypothetical protein
MKKPILYSLLFAVPGFFVSLILAFALFGFTAGFFWIFVFGDNTWPESAGTILSLLMVLFFLVPWLLSIWLGFTIGKRFESQKELNKKHLLISAALTLASILIIVLHQLNIGTIGPKTESQICADLCLQKGFSGSVIAPEESGGISCVCLDDSGREVLNLPAEAASGGGNLLQERPEETGSAYYCRKILPEIRPVRLNYQDESLLVTPVLLAGKGQDNALFAVRGSFGAAQELAREVVFKIDGETIISKTALLDAGASCGEKSHLIDVKLGDLNVWPEYGVELLVPDIKALFDVEVRYNEEQQ